MKKIIITSFGLLVTFIFVYFYFNNNEENIIIASCPTFYYMLEKIDDVYWVKTIKTSSTADSIKLYKEGKVDVVISGRPLKENEPDLISEKIGRGYDFIYHEEFPMWEEEMELLSFYTNLSFQEIINDFEHITENNLIQIEGNIEDYIDKGVVITSLEDRLIGGTAQIYKHDFSRARLTRLPRIHYRKNINKKKLDIIKSIIREE